MKKRRMAAAGGILALILVLTTGFLDGQKKEEKTEGDEIHIWYPGGYEILSKKELNDIEVVKELENRLGVSLDFSGNTGSLESSFATLLLDLEGTDAVYYRFSAEQLRACFENGQILDYTDYLDQMPNLKKLFEENPLLYQYASVDGKCLFFPGIRKNGYQEVLLAVRRDWMEQAGMEKPDSLSDLADMYRIQKQLFDEGSLENQGKYYVGLSSYNSYIDLLQGLFGTSSGVYWKEDRSSLVYGPSTENYRNYLIYLKELYQGELLDAHLYETETTDFEKYFLNNMSSSILTTGEQAAKLEAYSEKNGDNISLEYLSLDALAETEPAIYRTDQREEQVMEFGFVINADIEPEKLTGLLKVLDYLYSEEGMELMNWGLEGRHWIEEEGRRVYNPELLESQEYYAAAMAPYVKQDMLCIDRTVNWNMLDEDVRKALETAEASEPADYSFSKPCGYYTEEEENRLDEMEVNLSTFVEETSMNFIYRSIDPSSEKDWQDYLDVLEAYGLEEYLKGFGYKNEKILGLAVDLLILTGILLITWLLFGYPHMFSYFQELEDAKAIINPSEYLETVEEIHSRFDQVLMEVFLVYFLYESLFLIFWKTTPGRKLFGRRMECTIGKPGTAGGFLIRCLIIPTRTAVKLLFCYLFIPFLIAGALFFFSKKDRTLLDMIFLTRTVKEEQ